MTQRDRELLIKDLCARLPYGVKVSKVVEDWTSEPHPIRSINLNNIVVEDGEFEDGTPDIDIWDYEEIKPYLVPLSSMTDEQKREYASLVWFNGLSRGWNSDDAIILDEVPMLIDFYHKNHIDYRGFIPMGIALDATGLNIY